MGEMNIKDVGPAQQRYQSLGKPSKAHFRMVMSANAQRAFELAEAGKLRVSKATGHATGYVTDFDHDYFRDDVIAALVVCERIRLEPFDHYQDLAVVI
jgi:hypothetical protein